MSSFKFDIVVYGATGFTGQLVAEYPSGFLLHTEHAEFEWQRIISARKHDSCPGRFGGGVVSVNHPAHPDRLAAEIEIIRTRCDTSLE